MRVEDPLGGLVMGDGAQENKCMNKDSNHSSKSSGNDYYHRCLAKYKALCMDNCI